jgi:hypothetical protein
MKHAKAIWAWMTLAWLLFATVAAQGQGTPFSFYLDEPCKTSAGVFAPDGTLIRTLWSKARYYAPGTYSAVWDGLDDNGNAAPAGIYQIRLLQHNTEYVWDGAIGNTSAEISGPTVHVGFWPMADMAISGTNAFYVSGYDEGKYDFRGFHTTDPQHVSMAWYWVYSTQFNRVGSQPGDINDLNWLWVAADGGWVYFACSGTPNPNNTSVPNAWPGCVVACNVSDNSPAYFTGGVQIVNNGANSPLPNGIYVGTQPGLSGLAVQLNGNLLAVPVAPDNTVYLFDKRSGAGLASFNVPAPGRLSFSPDGTLWVISGNSVICYTNLNSNPTAALAIPNFSEPLDVAVNPTNSNIILVADGGASQQVKAFNSAGASLWTYGLAGGYQSNGVAVATNKFWFTDAENDETFLCFAPDGSFWVGDGGNDRSLHFSANCNYIEQIMYQQHSYLGYVDQNNPSRVFSRFLEFNVNYTKPLPQSWTLVNNWKANVPPVNIDWDEGLYEVTTFPNGRTYALIDNETYPFGNSELCELVPNQQLRLTGIDPAWSATRGWISFGPDGSARRTTIGVATWYEDTLAGYDASNNPVWNPDTLIASASNGSTDPVPRDDSFGNMRATISSNNILISFDQSLNNGWHLGGIRVGGTNWLWKASPAVAIMNGLGTYEISNGVTYAGNTVQAVDRNVIYGYHGEFFRGQGQAGQTMHFYDDGLFVGQFGEASPGHYAYEGALPGFAGNGHSPNLVKTSTGDYYLWVNDESDHGMQRWHLVNTRNIREQAGTGALGSAIALTNPAYGFPAGVTGKSGNQCAELSWLPVPGAVSYNIYYSLMNGGPYSIPAGSATSLDYVIGGLTNGQTYYFAVTAIQAGAEGMPSEQAAVTPFDTGQYALGAGSMTEGGEFTPVVDISSAALASGQPGYIGSEQDTGVLNPRELDYCGYGNLQNETLGAEGYVIYDWQGPGTGLTNIPGPFTVTTGSGWIDVPYLTRQYKVDNVLGAANGLMANPVASISIAAGDTNFHYLSVVSSDQFNNPRAFTMRLTSANGTSAAYTVNENPGLSHVFQFLFRGNVTLTADATVAGGSYAIVQALFLDNAAVTYLPPSGTVTPSLIATATTITSSQNPAPAGSLLTLAAAVSGSGGVPTGTVVFFDGSSSLGAGTLNSSGMAALSTAALSAAGSPHSITAIYGGDSAFSGSTASALSQIITNAVTAPITNPVTNPITSSGAYTSTTSLASSENPAPAGSQVAFSATVYGSGGGGSFASSYIPNGLVEWNKLNEGAGTVAADSSGNGNSLPLIGSPSWGDNYLTLNGSSQYGDAGSSQLAPLDQHDMTICAWINKTGSSQKGIVDKSFVHADGSYGGWSFQVLNNNYLFWWVGNAGYFQDDGGAPIPLGQWTFVAVVWHYAARQADFYVNGVLDSSVQDGAVIPYPSGTAPLEVGNLGNNLQGGTYAFDGSLHDVGIYNRALSRAEIETNYLSSEFAPNVNPPDLLYYEMTESAQVNPPVYLSDSSTHGGTTGTVNSGYVLAWVTNVASIPETAIHFNGVGTQIDTSNSVLFNFTTNPFTVNFWARPLTAFGCLMENGIPAQNGWYINVGGSYQVIFGTENNGTDAELTTAPGAAQVNAWSMVTIVRTGPNNAVIYINGIQAATTGSVTSPASSPYGLIIGADIAGAHYLDGDIWLPQIWGEALPPTAVANLYFMQLLGSPWPVAGGNFGVPTGTVDFYDGSSSLGAASLNSLGVAALSTAGLSAAGSPHSITAAYSGDSAFSGSTSSPLSQIITTPNTNTSAGGLSASWLFSEGSGTTVADSSGNGNTGTLINSPLWVAGLAGHEALEFPGASVPGAAYVSVPNSATLADQGPGSQITICAWVKRSSASVGNYCSVVAKDVLSDSPPYHRNYEMIFDTGSHILFVYRNSAGTSWEMYASTAAYTDTANWHFYCVTYACGNAASCALYVDGAPVSGSWVVGNGSDAPASTSGGPVLIGIDGTGTSSHGSDYGGISIYNFILSSSQVLSLYNSGTGSEAASTTAVASSQNPAPEGSLVTFTATVSGSGGAPSGTVVFYDGTGSLGSGTLNSSGTTSLSTAALSAAGSPHSITAVYGGDGTFAGSASSVLSQIITNASAGTGSGTSATVSIPLVNPSFESPAGAQGSVAGKPAGWVASNTDPYGVYNPAPGVYANVVNDILPAPADGSQVLWINAGNYLAQFLTNTLAASQTYTLSGAIGNRGDGYGMLTSDQEYVALLAGNTVIAQNTNLTHPAPGTFLAWTISYTAPAAGFPAGPLQIRLGQAGVGEVNYDHITLTAGPAGATPAVPSTTTVVSSQNPAAAGSQVTFTATVSGTGGAPTGTAAFFDGSASLGSGTLDTTGVTSFSTAALSAAGSPHSITAVYGGDGTFAGSTSSVLSQIITNAGAGAGDTVSIPLVNPSFESPAGAQGSAAGKPAGWVASNEDPYGVYNPAPGVYANAVNDILPPPADGSQVLWINAGNYLAQFLTNTLAAGQTYTLSGAIGNRGDGYGMLTSDREYVALVAGSTIIAQNTNLTHPAPSAFLAWTISYTAPAAGFPAGPLQIRLGQDGAGEVNYDNITLTATPAAP